MTGAAVAAAALAVSVMLISSPRRRVAPMPPRNRPGALPAAAWWMPAGAALTIAVAMGLSLSAGVSAVLVGFTTVTRRIRHRHLRQGLDESRALEAALDILVGELRAGVHPVRAFYVAAAETTAADVGAGLRAVAARAELGAEVPAGLRGIAAGSVLAADWERLAVSWQLASDYGLAMSTLMRTAQRDITERQRFSARVTAQMAGARATTAILAGLPGLGMLLGQLIGAAPLRFLFGNHTGGLVLVTGVMLTCCGLFWADRITDLRAVGR